MVTVPNKESKVSGVVVFTTEALISVSSICVFASVGGVCVGFFDVKKAKIIPMVKTNAENIDKNDKESLKVLSDKIPPLTNLIPTKHYTVFYF